MKADFLEYIKKEFAFDETQMQEFETCLIAPLKKSLRVNTRKISVEAFEQIAHAKEWSLTKTGYGKNTFYIDRTQDLDTALWNTYEHLAGYFYVQEVAASMSPYYLSNDTIDETSHIILDMSASPGGKSTQLAEYFPNSLIVANEIDKTRLKALEENIDRMWATNIIVTNYDGRHFKNTPESFDKILLDAPCSGEGTSFKTDEALKFWNIKNIETIARLQLQLLEAAGYALKVWGEMVYSTCTLNKLENEGVIETFLAKYWNNFKVIPLWDGEYKRNWPHREKTGGFFVAKIQKISSIEEADRLPRTSEDENSFERRKKKNVHDEFVRQNIEKLQNKQEKFIEDFLKKHFGYTKRSYFFKYKDAIYMTLKSLSPVWEKFFFYKTGVEIWTLKGGVFEPNFFFWTLWIFPQWILELSQDDAKKLFSWYEIVTQEKDGFYQAIVDTKIPIWICKIKWGKMKSLIPTKLIRK